MKKWADREEGEYDPVEFYNKHYSGFNRSRLAKTDNALYRSLSKKGLLDIIPADKSMVERTRKIRRGPYRYGNDPLTYYRANHNGVTQNELKKVAPTLYEILRRRGSLKHVPYRT